MPSNRILIVGLGNHGLQYQLTRHNIGFLCVQAIADKLGVNFLEKKQFQCEIATGMIDEKKIILAKPKTYMNLSGNSVVLLLKHYSIDIDDIVVIHDDIDLEFGKIKTKQGGGSGGHNGIKSIDTGIGSNNYKRIRVGIGRPPHKGMEVSDYVLGQFKDGELKAISNVIESVKEICISCI